MFYDFMLMMMMMFYFGFMLMMPLFNSLFLLILLFYNLILIYLLWGLLVLMFILFDYLVFYCSSFKFYSINNSLLFIYVLYLLFFIFIIIYLYFIINYWIYIIMWIIFINIIGWIYCIMFDYLMLLFIMFDYLLLGSFSLFMISIVGMMMLLVKVKIHDPLFLFMKFFIYLYFCSTFKYYWYYFLLLCLFLFMLFCLFNVIGTSISVSFFIIMYFINIVMIICGCSLNGFIFSMIACIKCGFFCFMNYYSCWTMWVYLYFIFIYMLERNSIPLYRGFLMFSSVSWISSLLPCCSSVKLNEIIINEIECLMMNNINQSMELLMFDFKSNLSMISIKYAMFELYCSIESSKGIYSIYIYTLPYFIINIMTNDFMFLNNINYFMYYMNIGDLIAVFGSIDFVLGSVDLSYINIKLYNMLLIILL